MAFPVILIDSATGSDVCGNATLKGTSASTSGDGLTVTLDGTPNLSGVATDGSAWIQILDSTAGARNFSKITGKDDGADTVTVAHAFGFTLSGKTWAINQTLASLGHANSVKLAETNAAAGDAMPGWIVRMVSGHSETIAASINTRRSGDTTSGPIIWEGISGAATRPLLTFSNNGSAFIPRSNSNWFRNFEMQNSNATKTASIGFNCVGSNCIVRNVKISHSTNKFWQAHNPSAGWIIEESEIGYCASTGISATSSPTIIQNNWIHHCGASGIKWSNNITGMLIFGNVISFNTGDGINTTQTGNTPVDLLVLGNVIHGNTSDGIEFAQTSAQLGAYSLAVLQNNIFSFNGGYGVNFSGSGISDIVVQNQGFVLRGNDFYTNTAGPYFAITSAMSLNEQTIDPSGGLASATKDYAGTTDGGFFQIVAALKGLGYPVGGSLAIGTTSTTNSYVDPGAAQRQEAAAGGPPGLLLALPFAIPQDY